MSLQNFKLWILAWRDRLKLLRRRNLCRYLSSIQILSSEQTISRILSEKLSISRYGDGEFYVMGGGGNNFQQPDEKLAQRLRDIIATPQPGLLVCIQHTLNDFSNLQPNSVIFASNFALNSVETCVKPYLPVARIYGDSLITRFYMSRRNKKGAEAYFDKLRALWDKRNLLIVEGSMTRLGIGNDSLKNAGSIRRIICPDDNAFKSYDKILAATLAEVRADDLIMISLGMTATVLAYDLCKAGFQALDLGHFDVEYCWMKMGAKNKCAVPGKRIAEVPEGKTVGSCSDSRYISEVVRDLTQI